MQTPAATQAPPDPAPEPAPEPSPELRKEWLRLFRIMYETGCVRLSTRAADGGRWLTDGFVLLDVTDSPAAEEVPDGRYKLVQSKGLVPLDGPNEFDPDGYFDLLAKAVWQPAVPSEWSVAEHPGKAMLFSVHGRPVFMGEGTWTTLRRHFGAARAEYGLNLRKLNMFRIMDGELVAAYVAGIQVPDGQEKIAGAIARLVGDGPPFAGVR